MAKRKSKVKVIASLTLYGMGGTTLGDRKNVADWLRRQARHVIKLGSIYAPRYRSRLYPRKGK